MLSDHTIAAWGRNTYGETNLPAGLTNIAAISAGGLHGLALKGDGTVVAWGNNQAGQCNVPVGLSNVVAIVAGGYNSYAIKSDGKMAVWGDNTVGQDNIPASVTNVVTASGGAYHSVAVQDNGSATAWGQYDSALPVGLTNAFALDSGFYMGLGLTNDGSPVITFQPPSRWIFSGKDTALRALVASALPLSYQWLSNGVPIPDATNAALIFPVVQTNCAALYSFVASNSLGVLTSSNALLTVIQQPPILTAQAGNLTSYRYGAATFNASAIGSLPLTFQWRLNGTNLPGATNATLSYTRANPGQSGNYSLVVSNEFGVAVSTNAYLTLLAVVDSGDSSYNFNHYATPVSLTNAVAVAAGNFHSMALKPDNSLIVWGNNQYGQTNIPASATNIITIAASGYTCAVIRSNGTIVMWGDSYFTGVGNNKTNPPPNATNAIAIAIGDNHNLVLRKNGTVVGWGNNQYGQTNVPASATNIMAIAVGSLHSLLLRSNGTLLAWGYNSNGQTNVPANLTNVIAIAATAYRNYVLKADGTTYAWGDAGPGIPQTYPTKKIVRLATTGFSGAPYFMTLQSDGTVAGGPNFTSAISNATAIALGVYHSLVLMGDGSPYVYSATATLPLAHPGDSVTNIVLASGTGPVFYQWQLNGTNISSATNATLILTNTPITSAGIYSCIISNALGAVTSPSTTLAMQRYPLLFSTTNHLTQMTANGFKLRVGGLAGQGPVIVYASSNLTDWTSIYTNTPTVGALDVVDPNATNQPAFFYKVSEGP